MRILEAELARQAMSIAGSTFQPIDTIEQALLGTKLLGQYPLAPVLTLFVLISSFTLVLLFLAVWIYAVSSSPVIESIPKRGKAPTVVELTQLRMTNPLALAAQLFSKDTESSLKSGFVEMFEADNTDASVGIGFVEKDANQRFEVYNLQDDEKVPGRPTLM